MLDESRGEMEMRSVSKEPPPADSELERVRRALKCASTEDFITLDEWRKRVAPHLNGTSR